MSTFRYSITEITESGDVTHSVDQTDSVSSAKKIAAALAESQYSELRITTIEWIYVRKDRKWSRHTLNH